MIKINIHFYKFLIVLPAIIIYACNTFTPPDFEKDKALILELEAKQREYHFTKNTASFVKLFSPDFLSINKGKTGQPTQAQNYERFNNYFKAVEFIKWDDIKEPVVRFSDDASVAYVAVNKEVIIKVKADKGPEKLDTTYFSWLSVYKKTNGSWQIDCLASTNQ